MRVELDEAEQRIAKFIGKLRNENNQKQGVVDARVGAQSSEEIDIAGFAAELAFCKMHNCYPDFEIRARQGTPDCWPWGVPTDVKSTTIPCGRLITRVTERAGVGIELYALMLDEWPMFRFAGFSPTSALVRPERITDLGRGPTYALDQSALIHYLPRR